MYHESETVLADDDGMIVRAHTHTRMVGSGVAMQEQLNNLAMVGQGAPPDLT